MVISILYTCVRLLLGLLLVRARSSAARDVELLVLRHEVRVLRRQAKRARHHPGDRLVLAGLSRLLPRSEWWRFPVRPETLLRWHRELVRRKWAASGRRRGPGRPPLPPDVRAVIVRLASENPGWGYRRIRGELLGLGHDVSTTAIRSVLRRRGIPPAPRRGGLAWPAFLRAQAQGVLACDFFAVETARLQVLHVLFFIELGTRRVFLAGCTERPSATWVAQQARNVAWDLADAGLRPTVLLRDRDATFPPAFDAVFASEGLRVVRTPVRAPRANAVAERWVGTARRECLDRVIILGERHLRQVLREFVEHYNAARPHRALDLRPPLARERPILATGTIVRRDRLGGLIHEYSRWAA
jgi:putative transposase